MIEIPTPCPADWNAMTGDDRRRFCAHCQRHVHDLSAMHSAEVVDLICRNAGNLCVQFERAPDGQVKTLDYQARPSRGWARYRWIIVGVLTAIGATVGRAAWQKQQPPPTAWRGAIVVVPPPRSAPASNAPARSVCPTE